MELGIRRHFVLKGVLRLGVARSAVVNCGRRTYVRCPTLLSSIHDGHDDGWRRTWVRRIVAAEFETTRRAVDRPIAVPGDHLLLTLTLDTPATLSQGMGKHCVYPRLATLGHQGVWAPIISFCSISFGTGEPWCGMAQRPRSSCHRVSHCQSYQVQSRGATTADNLCGDENVGTHLRQVSCALTQWAGEVETWGDAMDLDGQQ